jgi:hypothetical protein
LTWHTVPKGVTNLLEDGGIVQQTSNSTRASSRDGGGQLGSLADPDGQRQTGVTAGG